MPLIGSAPSRPDEAAVRGRTFKALHEVSIAASGVLDPGELAQLAVDHARDLVGGWSATLVWFEPGGDVKVLADNHPTAFPWIGLPPGRGMTGQILLTGEVIVVDDYATWEHAFDWATEGRVGSLIGVPLMVRDQPVGCLLVRSRERSYFQAEIRDVLSLLAAQVAPAIHAASLSAERQNQARLFRALHELAVAASGLLEPSELARVAGERCRELLQVDGTVIFHFDPQTGYLEPLHETSGDVIEKQVKPGEGAIGLAFSERRPYAVDDYATWEQRIPGPGNRGLAAGLSFPLVAGDQAIGAVGVWARTKRAWTENEIQILSLVAAQIGPALQTATAAKERETRAANFQALNEVALAAAGVLEATALARIAVDRARDLLRSTSAGLTWWDEEAMGLRVLADTDGLLPEQTLMALDQGGAAGVAFETGRPVVVPDYDDCGRVLAGQVGRLKSALVVPLLVRDRRVGTIGVASADQRTYSGDDVQLLTLLAAVVAPSLEAARLHEDLVASTRSVRESEGRRSAIVESALDCIVAADEGGRLIEFNPAAERTFGFRRGDVLGKVLWDTIIPLRLRGSIQIGVNANGGPTASPPGRRLETVGLRADGTEFPIELSVTAFLQDGKKVYSSAIRDLSERVHAETMRQESEAKSRFVAAMSHELRTPLNSILGFSQLLSNFGTGKLNGRQQRYVGHIESSGRHLLALINDVLDLSKADAGQMEVELEPLELHPLLEEAIDQLRPIADVKHLDLILDPIPLLWIRADRRRFLQVLLNLLSNAIKFTQAGGLVRVTAVRAGRMAEISVIDTGIGIPVKEQQRVFEEFTQVEHRDSETVEGTGLGLALSRRLLQLMLGTIQVMSIEGEGSTFMVKIPRIRPSEVSDARPLLLVVQGPVPDPALLVQLESGPYRLIATETAREAALIARRRRLAGVVIDDSLSPADEDWLRTALRDHPRTQTLPILSAAVALHPGVLIRD